MRKLIIILTVITVGCSDRPTTFSGHWHRLIDTNGLYHTITITDSSFIIDEYTFGGEFLFDDFIGDTIGIGNGYMVKDDNNEIIAVDEPKSWYFVNNTETDFIKDLSSSLFIEYVPESTLQETLVDSLPKFDLRIFIGRPKQQYVRLFSNSELFSVDGFYMQFADILLRHNMLRDIIISADTTYEYLLILADRNSPSEIINEIIELRNVYNSSLVICQAKVNLEQRILVNELMKNGY